MSQNIQENIVISHTYKTLISDLVGATIIWILISFFVNPSKLKEMICLSVIFILFFAIRDTYQIKKIIFGNDGMCIYRIVNGKKISLYYKDIIKLKEFILPFRGGFNNISIETKNIKARVYVNHIEDYKLLKKELFNRTGIDF